MKITKLISILLLTSLFAHAQEKKEDTATNNFKQRELVLYEQDFGEDTVGAWPSNLQVMVSSTGYNPRYVDTMFHVEKDSEGMFLKIVRNAQPVLEPIPKYSLYDSFTIEIDFLLEFYNSSITCMLTDDSERRLIFDTLKGKGQFSCGVSDEKYGLLDSKKTNIPGFDRKLCHRMALSYQKHQIKYYIDDTLMSLLTGLEVDASHVFFVPKGPVKIRHIRIATGPEITPVESLLSDKNFTTHAIQFDVNKSAVKHTSMDFINRLARFLKKTPSIKLEIDGHTDSDGDATANMKLSLDRANDVRRKLIAKGVASARLTTKGLGASKPIDTNTTIEGKANNRRVEFIRR